MAIVSPPRLKMARAHSALAAAAVTQPPPPTLAFCNWFVLLGFFLFFFFSRKGAHKVYALRGKDVLSNKQREVISAFGKH